MMVPDVAVICVVVPVVTPVAIPVLLMVAAFVLEDAQVATDVMSNLPLHVVAIAVNCRVLLAFSV